MSPLPGIHPQTAVSTSLPQGVPGETAMPMSLLPEVPPPWARHSSPPPSAPQSSSPPSYEDVMSGSTGQQKGLHESPRPQQRAACENVSVGLTKDHRPPHNAPQGLAKDSILHCP
ncbi:hypothetical protein ACOMHN_027951 [Nucella lapillus]